MSAESKNGRVGCSAVLVVAIVCYLIYSIFELYLR